MSRALRTSCPDTLVLLLNRSLLAVTTEVAGALGIPLTKALFLAANGEKVVPVAGVTSVTEPPRTVVCQWAQQKTRVQPSLLRILPIAQ